MSTFKGYINTELETINEFDSKIEPIKVYKIINDGYSPYDCMFVSAGTFNGYYKENLYGVCEVKTRDVSSITYLEGPMIEIQKLFSICEKVSQFRDELKHINKTINGFYLVKYTDKTYLFNLDRVNLGQVQYEKCPKNTAKNGNNNYKTKPVLYLKYEDAVLVYNN